MKPTEQANLYLLYNCPPPVHVNSIKFEKKKTTQLIISSVLVDKQHHQQTNTVEIFQ